MDTMEKNGRDSYDLENCFRRSPSTFVEMFVISFHVKYSKNMKMTTLKLLDVEAKHIMLEAKSIIFISCIIFLFIYLRLKSKRVLPFI